MDIQDTDVSEDAPHWFKIKHARVAKRPMSPTARMAMLPPRGKAECSTKSYVFSADAPAVTRPRGKFGSHGLMVADTVAKPNARKKDPTSMNARHERSLNRSSSTFRRQKGSLQRYLEQGVHNRHILPVQRSHQRLSPLTESLPKALARSQSAPATEFQKLYGTMSVRSLGRAATASTAARTRAMARSLRLARSQGTTFGNARPATSLSMSRAELRNLARKEKASEFARDVLQARAISRMSPRVTKDQAPGYTPHDSFADMQARPLSSTTLRGMTRRTRGSARPATSTYGSVHAAGPGGDLEQPESIFHVAGLHRPATALTLQHPHFRDTTHSRRAPRAPYSPISTASSARGSTARGFAAGSISPTPSRRSREPRVTTQDVNDMIEAFERKQGLHGPGYLTRKELRMKLRGTEEYNLGVDLKRASKDELIAAYNQYQQMVKDGVIDKEEHKRKKRAALEESLRLSDTRRQAAAAAAAATAGDAPGAASDGAAPQDPEEPAAAAPTAARNSRGTKQLVFNTRPQDTGPVKRLTPRSGSKLVSYFDA